MGKGGSFSTSAGGGGQDGFTLLEMAIVTALLGLMLSGGLFGLSTYLEGIAQRKTVENLDRIERALALYALQHAGLPCPDATDGGTPDGAGEYSGDACDITGLSDDDVAQGAVPYRDLGLQRDEALDGWKRTISYAVTGGFATRPDGVANPPSYSMDCSGGAVDYAAIAMDGRIEALGDPAGEDWPASDPPRAAYALISHGKNGFGAILTSGVVYEPGGGNADEQHNAQVGERSAQGARAASEIAAGATSEGFDDVVRARTPAQILYEIGCNSGTAP